MASLQLEDVAVSHAGRRVLDAVHLSIPDGGRCALLGQSGAGKSTLLRAIAGTHPIERGSIRLGGREVSSIPGEERGIALVAQAASLLPHRDVSGNIGFPLELRRLPHDEVDRRVRAQARAFSLGGLLRRRAPTLSAGETAEVVLARALVRRSTLLLMDEPFARIDMHDREVLIRDVLRMQEGYGATMLVATNDPHVAAIVAPTIAVLDGGRIVQTGTARELVERPVSIEVAWLIGESPLNVLPARLDREHGRTVLRSGTLRLPTWSLALTDRGPGGVQLGLRPEDLHLGVGPAEPHLAGQVVHHTFLGSEVDVTVSMDDAQVIVRCQRPAPPVGVRVDVGVPTHAVHVFDRDGVAIAHGA